MQTRLGGARSWTTPPGEQQVKTIGQVERIVGGIRAGSLEFDMVGSPEWQAPSLGDPDVGPRLDLFPTVLAT